MLMSILLNFPLLIARFTYLCMFNYSNEKEFVGIKRINDLQ
ncbi:hypothetical protein HMPREF9447_03050 [Bacteroides oleiciplenus YIT 12058]|uniref:Uncharacterized protein n=1 Tax=Bacteroides oleiciplenus YIT 12058 TaxID=742727 RepID=K9EF83_9BACE|nr:hypothetical protein HMPREF9447_03050 [Bacteroides oleiciplenus YIT 12058]